MGTFKRACKSFNVALPYNPTYTLSLLTNHEPPSAGSEFGLRVLAFNRNADVKRGPYVLEQGCVDIAYYDYITEPPK